MNKNKGIFDHIDSRILYDSNDRMKHIDGYTISEVFGVDHDTIDLMCDRGLIPTPMFYCETGHWSFEQFIEMLQTAIQRRYKVQELKHDSNSRGMHKPGDYGYLTIT